MIRHRFPVLCLATACLALASCSEEKLRTYKVTVVDPGESPVASAPAASPASGSLHWKVPDHWKEEQPGQFQKARYRLRAECEISISALPGDAGGATANVNRWREQVGLSAVENPEGERIDLKELATHATLHELRGESRGVLAAILRHGDQTWFFKLNAPVTELASCKDEFVAFLAGLHGAPAAPLPAVEPSPAPEKPRISLEIPDGWEKSAGSSMRVASFKIPGSGVPDGDVSVIPLSGDGGTTLDNVNRWRDQLNLPALKNGEPGTGTTVETASGPATIVHMVSEGAIHEGKSGAISAAILRTRDAAWFFKLTGEAGLVRQNQEKFESLVRSAILP